MSVEPEFNALLFEKRLVNLKDSQDSINSTCQWCLEHKQFHKKIVSCWLNVLKRVRVEQRLTLFYLANDVIQYSKRKKFDFVESWGTALQKATTLVRDASVKDKVLRIFKIWENRGVYGEEFITDLSGLISVTPPAKKIDETHEFQPSQLINKIRVCSKLETDTDYKLKLFKQHNPKMHNGEALITSLKDRAHVDDVEKEMEDYVNHLEGYIAALKLEIKARNGLINLLLTAESQLEKDRKDVKVVAVAYKSFASRVKNLKKKLDEKKAALSSPIPSPDINAPSPSPDSDLELPENSETAQKVQNPALTFNPGFYNPVTNTVEPGGSFMGNGFSSFMDSGMNFPKMDSNQSLSSLFSSISQPPPPPAPVPAPPVQSQQFHYNNTQQPLAPPPLPPFTDGLYQDYPTNTYGNSGSYVDQTSVASTPMDPYYQPQPFTSEPSINNNQSQQQMFNFNPSIDAGANSYGDEYNPEQECETWNENEWDQPPTGIETPASPPPIEKEGYHAPIVYHEGQPVPGAVDIDHRMMEGLNNNADKPDVDHRNLISLTGSPKFSDPKDIDERRTMNELNSRSKNNAISKSPKKQDIVESVDMELSDDENAQQQQHHQHHHHHHQQSGLLKIPPPPLAKSAGLLPPPPPFMEDAEGASFLGQAECDEEFEQPNGANGGADSRADRQWLFNQRGNQPMPPPLMQLRPAGPAPDFLGNMRRGRGIRGPSHFGGAVRGEFNNRGGDARHPRGAFASRGALFKFPGGGREFHGEGRPWRGRGRGRSFFKNY